MERDEQVGLDDVAVGENDVEGRVEYLAQPPRFEVVLESPLEPLGDALVERARGGHVEVSVEQLVALPVVRGVGEIRVLELVLDADHVRPPPDHTRKRPRGNVVSDEGHVRAPAASL